ncbi:MAG: hypothetical protein ACE5QF_09395 [Thermoplasmata archaeon]
MLSHSRLRNLKMMNITMKEAIGDAIGEYISKRDGVVEDDPISPSSVPSTWQIRTGVIENGSDRAIDLTDSLSFAIMERLKTDSAFTFDMDFEVHRFVMLPS